MSTLSISHQGLTLGTDKGIQSQSQLDKDGTDEVDADVIHGIADGIFRGAEGIENGFFEDAESHRKSYRGNQQQSQRVAQDFFRLLPVARTQLDRGQGRAALAGKGGKGRYQHNNGEGDAHAGERDVSHLRDVADVDSVHNIIKHIDDLSRYRRYRQFQHQRADGGIGQAFFVTGLRQGNSLLF